MRTNLYAYLAFTASSRKGFKKNHSRYKYGSWYDSYYGSGKEVADLVCRIQDTDVEIDGTIHDLFSIAKEMISGAISAYMQKMKI